MTTEDILQAGIKETRAGNFEKASDLLVQVVKADPYSEPGWLWLGLCRKVPEQKAYCFRKVLEINPNNAEAKHRLDYLTRSASPQMPGFASTSQASSSPAPVSIQPQQRADPFPRVAKRKKKNNDLTILVGIGAILLFCFTIAGLFILSQVLNLQKSKQYTDISSPAIATVTSTPLPRYTPVFENAPCEFVVPSEANATCGFVIVPMDRNGDIQNTIRVAVLIFHSTSDAPKPDPILYLQGGPGGKAIDWAISVYPSLIAHLIVDRDFIVFDPRGIGYTKPTLDCDEISKTYLSDLEGKLPEKERGLYYEGALLTCKNNFLKLGIKLSTYTSEQMAADAKDILVALGYQQVNLYGISYGTRLAQLMMRNYPTMVRSAILDSVVPVEVHLFERDTDPSKDVLHTLFVSCQNEPECAAAYPNIESVFYETIDQLNADPIKLNASIDQNTTLEQSINGSTFSSLVIGMLRNPQTIVMIPQLIYRTHSGDNSFLIYATAYPIATFNSISIGTYISVNCHDQVNAMSLEKLDDNILELCKVWDVAPLQPGENDPVVSDIPSLIFAGSYDLTTPPSYAHLLASHLSHSYLIEYPNQGHGPSATDDSGCSVQILKDFLADPNVSPNFDCVQQNNSVVQFLVPYDANRPVKLEAVTIEQYEIKALAPKGWLSTNFGFYNRNSSVGDLTQIGVQSSTIPEALWIEWLKSNFGKDRGLDGSVDLREQRQANGLKWNIYTTTSNGLTIDIAFTKSKGKTLMVLLACHTDEHDALYNTVFLPVIDSTTTYQ